VAAGSPTALAAEPTLITLGEGLRQGGNDLTAVGATGDQLLRGLQPVGGSGREHVVQSDLGAGVWALLA